MHEKDVENGITFLIKRVSGEVELLPGAEDIFRTLTPKPGVSEAWREAVGFGGETIYHAHKLPAGWEGPLRKVFGSTGKLCLGFQPSFRTIRCEGENLERLKAGEEGPKGSSLITALLLAQATFIAGALIEAECGGLFPDSTDILSDDDTKHLHRMFLEEYHPDKWGRAFSLDDVPAVSLDRISQSITATIEKRWPRPRHEVS